MNLKDYQQPPKTPLSFEEWKGSIAPQYSGDKLKAYDRLYSVDYEKEFNEMLKSEYAEYCDNLNGNWLLR
jgi:inosine/xanthosine triphosphate pyrophosphatase family protein